MINKEKTMKRIVSLLLTLTVLTSFAAFAPAGASAAGMTDVTGGQALEISVLEMLGVISGYPDGTFRPNASLTRAQFCKMVVVLLGKEASSAPYKSYTIYPDVKSSYWASGYINLAVKSLGLIKGFPDGTFRPEAPITYAQAITILMRALGYADADVGLSWPSGYISKAADISLTDGLSVSANNPISRGSGATLFYNMLNALTKDGKTFISTAATSIKQDAIILDNEAEALDGTKNSVSLAGDTTVYKSRSKISDTFVGLRGTLVFDSEGWVKAFIPDSSEKRSFVLGRADYPKLIASSGETYTLAGDTAAYINGSKKTFSQVCYDLSPGTSIKMIMTDAGTIEYIVVGASSASQTAAVLAKSTSVDGLASLLKGKTDGKIYKNGNLSTASDLAKYDVVTYNRSANIYSVSDFRVTAAYEAAAPNIEDPQKIKILGMEFSVLQQAQNDLAKYKIGSVITFLFTSDMQVAAVMSSDNMFVRATGYYDGTAIKMINGPTISYKSSNIAAGTLVKAYSVVSGEIQAREISDNYPNVALDLNTSMLGDKPISASARFYEKVGANGKIMPIDRSDIVLAKIASGRVFYVEYDSAGNATVILLNDVSGDLYEYGMIRKGTENVYSNERNPSTGQYDVIGTNIYVWCENSYGESAKQIYGFDTLPTDVWGGIATDRDGENPTIIRLKNYAGMTKQSFGSDNTMLINGVHVPISDKVHIYISSSQTFMKLSDYSNDLASMIASARYNGTSFDVYMEKAPAEGGKVRVIIVK